MSHDRDTFKANVDITGVGKITIGNHDISNLISGFEITANAQQVNKVTLHLLAPKLELDIDASEIPQIESEWEGWNLQLITQWIGAGPPIPHSSQLEILNIILSQPEIQKQVNSGEQSSSTN